MKNDTFILGTRPEIIKFAPLIKELNPTVIHTGQHKELAEEAFEIFNIEPDFNLTLMREDQNIIDFLCRCNYSLQKCLSGTDTEKIWVEGDTMSAFSGAQIAGDTELVHLESGLRSFDPSDPFPEEMIRKSIDSMSDILLAPTIKNVHNLQQENIRGRILKTGNTIVDALEMIKPKLNDNSPYDSKFILATVHRREAIDTGMREIFKALREISERVKVIIPIHPNPNVRKIANEVNLETVEPFDYQTFLNHLKHCEIVLTDSGGIQEEAPSFNTPVLVLRNRTERQELIESDKGKLVGWDRKKIVGETMDFLEDKCSYEMDGKNPFGDGESTKRIIDLMQL